MTPKIIRGQGFRGVLNYILQARERADGRLERPPVIGGNMGGHDARALASQFAAARKLRPDVKRPVWHCPLNLPPGEVISPEKFHAVAADFMAEMGFTEAHPWTLVLHREKAHLHAHIIASRISLDGTVWLGQHEARRAIQVCRELEKRHGLCAVPMPDKRRRAERQAQAPAPAQEMPMPMAMPMATTPSEPAVRAQRRAARRGGKRSDPHAQRVAVLDALARSSTPHELKAHLLALGVDVEFSARGAGEIFGWKLRRTGAEEWLRASSIHRDLAWGKVAERLALNRSVQQNQPTMTPESKPEGKKMNLDYSHSLIKKEIDETQPERAKVLADAARIALAELDAGETDKDRLEARLKAAGVTITFLPDEHGRVLGWNWEVAGIAMDPSGLDPRLESDALKTASKRRSPGLPAPAEAPPERAKDLADAGRIAIAQLDAGETDIERLTQRLQKAGVVISHRHDDGGQIVGWSWEVDGQRSAASALDPRLGWGHVQMSLRDAQQRAGLAPPPLGGRPPRGRPGLSPAERQAGETSLARRLRAFGFRAVEAEGTALWANRRGDQIRVLADRVELHAAPGRVNAARCWDDRAVNAWVLAAKATQGDRLSLVNAALDADLRRLLIEACAAENVVIVELADEIEQERERRRALIEAEEAEIPALGLQAAPAAPADEVKASPATDAAQPSPTTATAAAQPSPADATQMDAGEALITRMRALRTESLALSAGVQLRQRAAELRKRLHAVRTDHFLKSDDDYQDFDEALRAARNRAMTEAVAAARRDWDLDLAAGPGQPRFEPLLKGLREAEATWAAARAVPEPSRLADPLGRAAARRQEAIDVAARDLEAARQRLKALSARIYHDPEQRAALDRRTWLIYAEREPALFEAEHLDVLARDIDKAALDAEQRERQAATQARMACESAAARQRLQDQADDQDNDDDDDDQRRDRPRGG